MKIISHSTSSRQAASRDPSFSLTNAIGPGQRIAGATACLTALLLAQIGWAVPQKKIILVALGDSTTAGAPFFRSPLESPPDGDGDPEGQYTYWMMGRRPRWDVLNYGITGQRSDEIRARFSAIYSLGPRYVIILAGLNDIFQGAPLQETAKNLLWMYQEAKVRSIMPVAATVPPFDRATPTQAQAVEELNRWITRTAEKLRIPIADLNAAARDPENPRRLSNSPDGLHPDVGGYRKMGLALIDAIDPIEKAWR